MDETTADDIVERYVERMVTAACGHRWLAYARIPVPAVMDAELTSVIHHIIDNTFARLAATRCPACEDK